MLPVGDIEAGMSRWQAALRLIGVGWYVGGCIVLGVFAGLWLDDKFNTTPILVIVCLILGVIIAFYGMYRMILPNIGRKGSKGNS
jgi:F0F1-type ATP synthase assembly protein I